MKLFIGAMLLTILFLEGCNSLGTGSLEGLEARILPGSGIDGVNFGDSKETVLAKLGTADQGSIADGFYKSWFVGDYLKGPHAGLSVYFLEEPINTAGPIDLLTIHSPYSGKTKEGIGIDSPVNEVRAAFGEPKVIYNDYSSEKGVYSYVYCMEGKRLQIGFREDHIEGMGLGYYKSPPDTECP
jgi:hypothetical protein